MLTREIIQKIAPRPATGARAKIWDGYVAALTSPAFTSQLPKAGICTKQELAMALAQWKHECGGFTIIWESGAYSAKTIMKIFGVGKHSAKVTPAEARVLAAQCKRDGGQALFNRVYGSGNPKKARELGNVSPNAGWLFRGLGIVQITGERDHRRFAEALGVSIDALQEPINLCLIALMEWQDKKLSAVMKRGGDVCYAVTKKINGGTNGLDERRRYYAQALKIVPNDVFDVAPTIAAIPDRDRAAINAGIPPESLEPASPLPGPELEMADAPEAEEQTPSKMALAGAAAKTVGTSKTIWSWLVGIVLAIVQIFTDWVVALSNGIAEIFSATPKALEEAQGLTSPVQDVGAAFSVNVGGIVMGLTGLLMVYGIWRHFQLKHAVNQAK